MMETRTRYPSIFETLFHNLIADLNCLRRYRDAFKENKVLSNSKLLFLEEKSLRKEFESDYTKLYQYRKQVDDLIVQFVDQLEENKLNSVVKYRTYKREDGEKEVWKTLLHWFNHQTHHRGQVSVLLDLIGVDPDYCLRWGIVEEPWHLGADFSMTTVRNTVVNPDLPFMI
jgi:uncharacterized damage-inducible protein DinB